MDIVEETQAGAYVFLPNNIEIELKQPVSKLASILLGELVSILIMRDTSSVLIFCDSQSAAESNSLVGKIKVIKTCYGHTAVSLQT